MTNKESKDNLIEIHGLWCKDIVNVLGYSFCKKAASSGIQYFVYLKSSLSVDVAL